MPADRDTPVASPAPARRRAAGLARRAVGSLDHVRVEVVQWRALSGLFGAGGVLVLLSLLTAMAPQGDPATVAALGTVAIATSVAIALLAGRLPVRGMSLVLGFGTVLITLATMASDQPDGRYSLLYVWVALQAFFFLRPWEGVLHVALLAAGYALALQQLDGGVDQWLLVVGTSAVAGGLVLTLRLRIDHLHGHASVDAVTGIGNRRAFDRALGHAVRSAATSGGRFALAIADMDDFKALNDRHGHTGGDRALRRFAALARGALPDAAAYRLGGDEFAVLFADAGELDAREAGRRLVRLVRQDRELATLDVTASVGIAAFPEHGESAPAVLRAADEALYGAKALGRDRAMTFTEHAAHPAGGAPAATRQDDGAQLATVLRLAEAIDLRDAHTATHSETVARHARAIAEELGLPPGRCARVELAGLVHDLGKIAVPDAVLFKTGPLTDAEWLQIRRHPETGAWILDGAGLPDLAAWVLAHHERVDGRGYPRGLAGDDIPLEARILAVADAFEAMTADRPYRPGGPAGAALEEIMRCAGTQFDPDVARAFGRALPAG